MAKASAPPPLEPLRFRPVLKSYVWGGRALETFAGRELPPGVIAESWEISDHPNGETPVAGGPWHDTTLASLLEAHGVGLLGSSNLRTLARRRFPLLIKLLDANEWLSVQVHPGDRYARHHEDDLGKTEMWVVLDARPDAEIILGFDRATEPDAVRNAIEDGKLEELLHRVPARPGDVFFVPAGTVHAIGPGLVLAEIQQTSDVTYRLYDWDRSSAEGSGRELHLDDALAVANWDAIRPGPVTPRPIDNGAAERELLVDCAHFRTERLRLDANAFQGSCDGTTFEIWGVVSGSATIDSPRGTLELEGISWALLPAGLGSFEVRSAGRAELLRVTTPAPPSG